MPRAHFESLDKLESTYWWHANRHKLAMAWLRPLRLNSPSILDLGCGTGGFLEKVAQELGARRTVGVDASASAVEFSREKHIEVRQADLSAPLRIDDGGFDIVTSMDVLEHLPEEKALLETARNSLRPGGFLLASAPALPWLYSSWDKELGHYRRYSRSTLKAVVSIAGFDILKSSYAVSYAIIPMLVRRLIGKSYTAASCIFPPVGHLADCVLKTCGSIEAAWVRHVPLPIGLSLFILARKPEVQS